MKTDKVISAKQKEDRSIELTIKDPRDETTTVKRYVTIRGGISWPTAKAPAYFCILAQEYITPLVMSDRTPTGRRVLLAEHESESLSLTGFYGRITDIADQMLCYDFYAEMPEDRQDSGFLNDFDDFARERKSNVFLWDAPDVGNFLLGLTRIKDDIDKGELVISDDSIVYGQLRSIIRADLEGTPEETFIAIKGLRHVIGSYYRDAPQIQKPYQMPDAPNWRVA